MNIDEAKVEVKNAVRAYLEKDEVGQYEIPVERQRPILLMGPPGIGKTAVMEQIAHELGIGLVSYTITHHTRQSAIGLPKITEKSFGGKEYSVTEYTMSEIIGAVYEQIEKSGVKEGILFLDEINCVSETLAPTMLQFLQYKTFGSHKLPEGYIIVTAGNPPQYNKSVRDFDIVTLDRVRQINIEEDFEAWKDYAYKAGVHGSILAYLEIKKDNFYNISTDVNGRSFVTARGWEDLSRIIKVYEKLGIGVDENLTAQYLQNKEIARDFATYYELYRRYNELYKIPDILEGRFPEDKETLRKGSFDEKLSIIGLLSDKLMEEFRDYAQDEAVQKELFEIIKVAGNALGNDTDSVREYLENTASSMEKETENQLSIGMISREDERIKRLTVSYLRELLEKTSLSDGDQFEEAKKWFKEREDARQARIVETGRHLTNSFEFLEQTFGDKESLSGSQEMVIFLTELSSAYHSLKFVRETGNDAYYKYNKLLLLNDRKQELKDIVKELVL
ncbi:ATPase family associated with various cellular activities (AAA) [Butyrivibrio proteoclasticus]|uniref:ATPase family associated with various cellular activities (AAA) n=1 Tax=Butyrivibrio proteoclasticus TaxID=43305 RepID=A0A1I5X4L3_9FIRM|nr:AAA family ATPase [Butyrivibrio proteoclasticus]SFQ26890.1 ATPase family associated with various cellular activities (AAA) [Butyrivibrio proteoclasticus]